MTVGTRDLYDIIDRLEVEVKRLNHHHAEFVLAANIRMTDQKAEIEQLKASNLKLAEENLQLRQIIDGYMRAKP